MLDDITILIALAFLGTMLGVWLTALLSVGAWHAWSSWADSPDINTALEPDFPLLQRIQQQHAGISNDALPTMVMPWRQEHMAGF